MTQYTLRDILKMALGVCEEALLDPLQYYDPYHPKLVNYGSNSWVSGSSIPTVICRHCGRSHNDRTCPGCGSPN